MSHTVFDRGTLLDMLGGDEEMLDEITTAFFGDAPVQLERMRSAIATRDPKAMQEAAHSLKGAAATITAASVAEVASRIELAGHNGETNVETDLQALEAALAELQRVVHET